MTSSYRNDSNLMASTFRNMSAYTVHGSVRTFSDRGPDRTEPTGPGFGPLRGRTGPKFTGPRSRAQWTGPEGRTRVGPGPDLKRIIIYYFLIEVICTWLRLMCHISHIASTSSTTIHEVNDTNADTGGEAGGRGRAYKVRLI